MVSGLDKFKEFFEDYSNNYVLIGGTACSIIFDEIGLDFRAKNTLTSKNKRTLMVLSMCK